jgi:hypothetical protein
MSQYVKINRVVEPMQITFPEKELELAIIVAGGNLSG